MDTHAPHNSTICLYSFEMFEGAKVIGSDRSTTHVPSSIKSSIGSSTKGQNSVCARHQWPALHVHPCLYVYTF